VLTLSAPEFLYRYFLSSKIQVLNLNIMKKLIILAIFTICVHSIASSQTRKNFYSVTLDTIQHINWPKHQTVEQAQRNNTLE
jgi:hypothetical protein